MIRNSLVLAYAAIGYGLAMASLACLAGFLSGLFVPKAINDGVPGALWPSVLVDIGLVWLFGLHHSATARRWFKRILLRILPAETERPTYLLMTAGMTALLVVFWRPVPVTLWQVEAPLPAAFLTGAFVLVLAAMFVATFHFGHFGFFGLAQAWNRFRGRAPEQGAFCSRWLYGMVRHPISLGWMLLPWLTPHMTVGQLVFALATIAYVLVATLFEEADLVAELGDTYRRYRSQVPAFLPRIGRSTRSATALADQQEGSMQ